MILRNKNYNYSLKVFWFTKLDKTIVGHTLKSDFEAMEFKIEDYETRDLMKVDFLKLPEGSSKIVNYWGFKENVCKIFGLGHSTRIT